jgi:hypothetical protein
MLRAGRRAKASRRIYWVSIALAAIVGFLVGDWHATKSQPAVDLSASQNIALRFPEANAAALAANAEPGDAALANSTFTPADFAAADPTSDAPPTPMVLGKAEFALFSPEPIGPVSVRRTPAIAEPPPVANGGRAAPSGNQAVAAPAEMRSERRASVNPRAERKPAGQASNHGAGRTAGLLNDAQIANIKRRLHLTADQERMWPAVEAALRNIAYAKARARRERDYGTHGGSAVASIDPNSAEVQDLKTAAIPLIMSFSDEQKSEVRNLAHVMGLDKLASEF